MAAVTVVELHPTLISGYEVNVKGMAVTDLAVGQLLVRDSATTPSRGNKNSWKLAPAGTVQAQGIVLKPCKAGKTVSVGLQGEMEGFSGLTPGAGLFPSASVAGGIDTTATLAGTGVNQKPDIRADSATGIIYNFL